MPTLQPYVPQATERGLDLRLALPRTLHLSEYGAGGAQPSGPANSGWPDSGVELAISLVLPATADPAAAAAGGGVEARVGSGECVARVAAGAGALLLLLLLVLLPARPPPTPTPYYVYGTRAVIPCPCTAGGLLLMLARRARCVVPPLSTPAVAVPPQGPLAPPPQVIVLTLYAYSAHRRSADGLQLLGVDPGLL